MSGLFGPQMSPWGDPRSEGMGLLALAQAISPRNKFVGGLLNYGQQVSQAQDNDLRRENLRAQIDETRAQAQERQQRAIREQQAMEQAARLRKELPGLFTQPGMTGGQAVPQQIGGVPMFSKPVDAAPMRQTQGGFDVSRALALGMDPKSIVEYAGLQNLGRPKATRQMEVDDGKGGKRIALVDDFGQEVAAFAGYTPPVQVNRGGSVDFVKPTAGVSLPMTMSFADRNAAANLALSRERMALDKTGKPSFHDGQWVYPPSAQNPQGGAVPVAGFTKPPKEPSEGERKAATLLMRLQGSQAQLTKALEGNPGAAKPEVTPAALRAAGMETPANFITSEPRQQVEAAQLDMLDAALTLGTGAAYTREQLEGYRKSYFPQLGDDQKTVEDKQARLQNVIQAAKIAAGRAGASVAAPTQPNAQPNPASFADPGKESRYQAWKRSQGK